MQKPLYLIPAHLVASNWASPIASQLLQYLFSYLFTAIVRLILEAVDRSRTLNKLYNSAKAPENLQFSSDVCFWMHSHLYYHLKAKYCLFYAYHNDHRRYLKLHLSVYGPWFIYTPKFIANKNRKRLGREILHVCKPVTVFVLRIKSLST